MSESFYKILGVDEKSSKEEIKKAYRGLSLKHHPDRNNNNAESNTLFQKINEAYETLGDDQKRTEYDAMQSNPFLRMNGNGGGNHGMNANMDDIFQAFFGGSPFGPGFPGMPGFHGMGGGPNIRIFTNGAPGGAGFHFQQALQKPTPIIKTINVNMEQVLNGTVIPVEIERWIVENGNKLFEKETLYVNIPKGLDDNEIIIIRDKGNTIDENLKGDVKLFIKIENNSPFIRSGLDLLLSKTISLKDALCGFTFELPFINGKVYTLNCSSGTIVHPGYKKILPNMGLTRDAHTGNLIIEFQVQFPDKINEEQIANLSKIL
jgi:DnaJ-class molecular chaperone